MVLVALLWIPVIQGARGLYDYLQGIQAYLAPPIAAVFFLGVFMKRLNAAGCLAALVAGFALGLFRLAVDTPVTLGVAGYESGYAPGSLLWIVNNIYFQYYGLLIFLVSVAVMIGVSYATAPPPDRQLAGLTYATVSREQRDASRRSWDWREVAGSAARARAHRRHLRLFQRMTDAHDAHAHARRQVHVRPLDGRQPRPRSVRRLRPAAARSVRRRCTASARSAPGA